ncbi:hypothetical protein [Salinigranum salinum]|uniref:hypothetical protein n=1 Tax=Salinigranum salinum TaxID=1364937 RepID=UPI0018654832|nr:hypothetical protein [Salinigranum salinum]
MTPWDRHETHALVDALLDSNRIDAETAARAHEFVDGGHPSRALTLVRLAISPVLVLPL